MPLKKKMMAESKPYRSSISFILILTFIIFFSFNSTAQVRDSLGINRKRLTTFALSAGVAYGTTLIGLNNLWYKNNPRQSFRFFNDNPEWKQVDKFGHFYSSFYLSYGTSQCLRWSNVPVKKSDIIGSLSGFLILVPIEIFDGFSQAYGASTGDLLFDAGGSTFFLGQKLLWNEIRLIPKFSFHYTSFAGLRPNVLGDGNISEILKDYNGQTYWISADMDKFLNFPKWLNIAAGYGAQGMVYARDSQNNAFGYKAYRQYYLSLDIDLKAIRTKSKFLKTLIFIGSMIKLPAPAIEFSNKKLVFHTLYF